MKRWIAPLVALTALATLLGPALSQTAVKPAIVYSTAGSSTNPSTKA
jgi:hypothetical protein